MRPLPDFVDMAHVWLLDPIRIRPKLTPMNAKESQKTPKLFVIRENHGAKECPIEWV